MQIMIGGASGLVGTRLAQALTANNANLTLVGRSLKKLTAMNIPNSTAVTWDDLTADLIKQQDVVINLAGENIGAKRWSTKQKQKILSSRIDSTKRIADLCAQLGKKSPKLIQASAIGYYGSQYASLYAEAATEDAALDGQHHNFLSEIATAWESALQSAIIAEVPVVIARFAVILDAKQGALAKMLPSFKFGAGAVLGNGQQPFPWVTIDDVVNALLFFIEHKDITGIYNIVADEAVNQKQFAKTLAQTLHRPCFASLPAAFVKSLFGEMGQLLLLEGCHVSNQKIQQAGFSFQYPELQSALTHLLQK